MKGVMADELRDLEPKLKEILYRFLEEVRATKAALYLIDENEQFQLLTQYGFRDSAEKSFKPTDDLVDRLITKRGAYLINGLTADPRFSELLYHSDTSRILVAPIYSRGKLIGFVDLRDKARQAPFENDDLRVAQKIVDEFLDLFVQKGLFGQRNSPPTNPGATPLPAIELSNIAEMPAPSNPISRVMDEARAVISRGALRPRAQAEVLTEEHMNAAALALPALVALPGVLLAALSPISRLGGTQIIAARTAISQAALEQFEAKVRGWLKKRGESGFTAPRTQMVHPFGTAGVPIEPARILSVLSAPVKVGAQDGLVLSVGFDITPDATARGHLERFLLQVQQLVSLAKEAENVSTMRNRVADKLLEPDFQKFPALVAHSRRVSELAERFAHFVNLSDEESETIRLAGLLHDIGMRFLDYRNLYRKNTPSTEDLRLLRSHPELGAAVVAESALGPEIATLILSHHERPDGTGYPDRLAGDRIPFGSKIIAICEAYDAMTAPDSYQPPVQPAAAVAKIRRSADQQFDAELSVKFAEMMRLS